MKDNEKLFIALALMIGYGLLVWFKFAESSGFIVLLTYAIKKLMDMHEDQQNGGSDVSKNSPVVPSDIQKPGTSSV